MDPKADGSADELNVSAPANSNADVSNGHDNHLGSHDSALDAAEHNPTLHTMALDSSDTQAVAHQQAAQQQQNQSNPVAATQTIQMRALIVTQDASIIIGKGGRYVWSFASRSFIDCRPNVIFPE